LWWKKFNNQPIETHAQSNGAQHMNRFQSFAKASLATFILTTGSAVFAGTANDVLPEIKAIAAKPEVTDAGRHQDNGRQMDCRIGRFARGQSHDGKPGIKSAAGG
jgi:hypothetical protein